MKKHHVEIDSIYSELKNILEESDVEIIKTKNFIFLYQPKNIDINEKFCLNCKYVYNFEHAEGEYAKCGHPNRMPIKIDPVKGPVKNFDGLQFCSLIRKSTSLEDCGHEGRFFEEKEQEKKSIFSIFNFFKKKENKE